ncbi:uncharacterized protein LOC115715035 [Cannabis sativa]|uniref:uncharacterized protein LOC115715035 n=1 Tax=Cannabis sativa TaxID=3483 RepID=UPI0029CA6D28|nr:uncharacterized protein LOC115715035 [Cannabis sativa]
MATELTVQLVFFLMTLGMFFVILKYPKQALTKFRTKNRTTVQSGRHLAQATNLLDRARSIPHKAQSQAHAKNALAEAEKAISLSPRDPSAHIIKAMASDLMDRRSSALRSLDLALSPPCVKSLSGRARRDALIKRAELNCATNRRRRIDSAVEDLVEAIRLCNGDADAESRALCLLGQCYEWKGLKESAWETYEKAIRIEPGLVMARQGLERLSS